MPKQSKKLKWKYRSAVKYHIGNTDDYERCFIIERNENVFELSHFKLFKCLRYKTLKKAKKVAQLIYEG